MANVSIITEFAVTKSLFGNRYCVEYVCPQCRNPLKSEEEEIGNQEICPHCSAPLLVSDKAKAEIQARRDQIERPKQRKLSRKRAREAQQEAERQQREAEWQQERARDDQAARAAEQMRQAAAAAAAAPQFSWKLRFPNLSSYLELLDGSTYLMTFVLGFAVFIAGAYSISNDATGLGLMILIVGALCVALIHVASRASIEFIRMLCSIEEQAFALRSEISELKRTWFRQ
jgi:DNA-directed RNA polymerase subunit RPC12/RpoP